MKHNYLFLFLFFLSITAFTQDLIVPREGDIPARGEISTMMTAPDPGQLLLRIPGNVAPLAVSRSSGRSGSPLSTHYIMESIPEARQYTPHQIAAAAISGSERSKVDDVVVRKVLKSIGGVAFGGVAEASQDLTIETLSISYQHSLIIELNGNRFALVEPPWLILPALQLAVDNNWSLVSLTPPRPSYENALNALKLMKIRKNWIDEAPKSLQFTLIDLARLQCNDKLGRDPRGYFECSDKLKRDPISYLKINNLSLEQLAIDYEWERDYLKFLREMDGRSALTPFTVTAEGLTHLESYPWKLAEEIRELSRFATAEKLLAFPVAIHPVLYNTAVGYALVFLDFSMVNPELLDFALLPPLCAAGKDWATVVFEKFGRGEKLISASKNAKQDLHKIHNSIGEGSYLIFDSRVSVFITEDGLVLKGGGPDILFHGDGTAPFQIKFSEGSSNDLRDALSVAYRVAERFAQLTAFFRLVAKYSPDSVDQVIKEVEKNPLPVVPTPGLLKKDAQFVFECQPEVQH